jgi:hypothetical protein
MTGLWITAGLIVAAVIATPFACAAIDQGRDRAWRRETGQDAARGRHRAPRPLPAVIPRAPTEHAPPWDDAPVTEPAKDPGPGPVLEPAAVTSGPPCRDVPEAWVLTAVVADGRLVELHGAVMPPVDWPAGPVLPPWVAAELGHDSTDDALESMFTRAMALKVRALTDGTT